MKLLFTALLVISCCNLLCQGLQKHNEKYKKYNNLTRFFKENNTTDSSLESRHKDGKAGKYKQKNPLKIKNSLTNKGKESMARNVNNSSKPKSHPDDTALEKKYKAIIRDLLCELFNATKTDATCKKRHHYKKAMIWPTKMIPWLKRVLMNKLNGGAVNHMSSFLNTGEDSTTSSLGGGEGTLSNMMDNWDSGLSMRPHRKHHHGLKMVPLLKMLRKKLYGQKSTGEFGNLNDALNGEGYNGFGPLPTQGSSQLIQQILGQTAGKSDRNTVLNEMMQEFLLANGQERQENEGNEAFSDLTGRNNLAPQFNTGLQNQEIVSEPSQGVGIGQLGGMNMDGMNMGGMNMGGMNTLQGSMRTPVMAEAPIHAQMLDNGALAPMPRQPLGGGMMKSESMLGGSPIGRSPFMGSTLGASSMGGSLVGTPTVRSSQLQNSFLESPAREGGSLLQKAGGFDAPILPSALQRTANPTQRMYTENVGGEQGVSEDELSALVRSQEDEPRLAEPRLTEPRLSEPRLSEPRLSEPSISEQRLSAPRLSGSRGYGNNMIMEEISDSTARGRRPIHMQSNPDLNRLLKLHSNFRETPVSSYSRLSRLGNEDNFQHGLRLPMASNNFGMASLLSKDQDSFTIEDMPNQRALAFRRGKVLKKTAKSNLHSVKSRGNVPKESKAQKGH